MNTPGKGEYARRTGEYSRTRANLEESAERALKKPTTPDDVLAAVRGQLAVDSQTPKKLDHVSVGDIFGPLPAAQRYDRLKEVLTRAFNQAATGKGAARHGQDLPFEQQPMQTLSRSLGSNVGLLYQAAKKAQESLRLDREHAVFELLGAINYLAGAVIFLEDRDGDGE